MLRLWDILATVPVSSLRGKDFVTQLCRQLDDGDSMEVDGSDADVVMLPPDCLALTALLVSSVDPSSVPALLQVLRVDSLQVEAGLKMVAASSSPDVVAAAEAGVNAGVPAWYPGDWERASANEAAVAIVGQLRAALQAGKSGLQDLNAPLLSSQSLERPVCMAAGVLCSKLQDEIPLAPLLQILCRLPGVLPGLLPSLVLSRPMQLFSSVRVLAGVAATSAQDKLCANAAAVASTTLIRLGRASKTACALGLEHLSAACERHGSTPLRCVVSAALSLASFMDEGLSSSSGRSAVALFARSGVLSSACARTASTALSVGQKQRADSGPRTGDTAADVAYSLLSLLCDDSAGGRQEYEKLTKACTAICAACPQGLPPPRRLLGAVKACYHAMCGGRGSMSSPMLVLIFASKWPAIAAQCSLEEDLQGWLTRCVKCCSRVETTVMLACGGVSSALQDEALFQACAKASGLHISTLPHPQRGTMLSLVGTEDHPFGNKGKDYPSMVAACGMESAGIFVPLLVQSLVVDGLVEKTLVVLVAKALVILVRECGAFIPKGLHFNVARWCLQAAVEWRGSAFPRELVEVLDSVDKLSNVSSVKCIRAAADALRALERPRLCGPGLAVATALLHGDVRNEWAIANVSLSNEVSLGWVQSVGSGAVHCARQAALKWTSLPSHGSGLTALLEGQSFQGSQSLSFEELGEAAANLEAAAASSDLQARGSAVRDWLSLFSRNPTLAVAVATAAALKQTVSMERAWQITQEPLRMLEALPEAWKNCASMMRVAVEVTQWALDSCEDVLLHTDAVEAKRRSKHIAMLRTAAILHLLDLLKAPVITAVCDGVQSILCSTPGCLEYVLQEGFPYKIVQDVIDGVPAFHVAIPHLLTRLTSNDLHGRLRPLDVRLSAALAEKYPMASTLELAKRCIECCAVVLWEGTSDKELLRVCVGVLPDFAATFPPMTDRILTILLDAARQGHAGVADSFSKLVTDVLDFGPQ